VRTTIATVITLCCSQPPRLRPTISMAINSPVNASQITQLSTCAIDR
jgi:hypothetical protein